MGPNLDETGQKCCVLIALDLIVKIPSAKIYPRTLIETVTVFLEKKNTYEYTAILGPWSIT